MKFPWANTLLLALIAVELVSGFFGLVSSSPREWYFIVAHRISGYGIVVILAWKGANVLFSLRWNRAAAPRTASVVLMALLAVTLALGFAWSFVGPFGFGWFSGVSWHIYVGAALIPLLVWHALYHTRGFPIAFWADRRTFLRLAALAVAATAAWQAGELSAKAASLSGAKRRFTGSHEARSFSGNAFPLTSWLNDSPARIDPAAWRLTVGGAVERELSLAYDDLVANAETTATIDCTGGWYSTQVWRGVAVADLLARAGPIERGLKRHLHLRHRLLPPLLHGRGLRLHPRLPRRRRDPLPRPRLPPAPRRARQARIRVGQVGRRRPRQHNPQVAPTPTPHPVVPPTEPFPLHPRSIW